MQTHVSQPPLKDAKALVVGVANEHSIAYGCAKAFRELGADLALTYLNDKAKPFVEPLARGLEAPLFLPLDFAQPGQLEAIGNITNPIEHFVERAVATRGHYSAVAF